MVRSSNRVVKEREAPHKSLLVLVTRSTSFVAQHDEAVR
jgi:hypothetical protein